MKQPVRPPSALITIGLALLVSLLIGSGGLNAIGDEDIQGAVIYCFLGIGVVSLLVGIAMLISKKNRQMAIALALSGLFLVAGAWFAVVASFGEYFT